MECFLTGWVGQMEVEIFPPGGFELQLVRSSIVVEYLLDEAGALGGVAVAKEEDLRVFACRYRNEQAGKEQGKDESHIFLLIRMLGEGMERDKTIFSLLQPFRSQNRKAFL